MPRAERRKRMQEEQLNDTAAKTPKLTTWFQKSEGCISMSPTPVTSSATSAMSVPSAASSEESVAPPATPVTPEISSTAPKSSECQSACCTGIGRKPFHPTPTDLKRTSVKQTTSNNKGMKFRLCPSSIFLKYTWVTYCMTKGTIACFFCKRAFTLKLLTFSRCAELAFCSGDFSNWKKCHEKLEKHAKSHCHGKAVEKVMYFNDAGLNIGAKLDRQYQMSQELHRQMFLKQLSSLKYLVCQGLSIGGNTDMESDLLQLLKTRAEDVPELMQWIEQGQYLSADVINELIEMMGNTDEIDLQCVAREFVQRSQQRLNFFEL
nr:PREDICTED: protein FAM221A isoform X2 [Latimeria chalumnae]|eukprot:XP_005997168.1 PREDICTED: protein FAM221A isoform X2 [Latimeria chalumnae]